MPFENFPKKKSFAAENEQNPIKLCHYTTPVYDKAVILKWTYTGI